MLHFAPFKTMFDSFFYNQNAFTVMFEARKAMLFQRSSLESNSVISIQALIDKQQTE